MTLTIARGKLRFKFYAGMRFAFWLVKRAGKRDASDFAQLCNREVLRALKEYKKRCGGFVLFEAEQGNTRVTVRI
ncbi:MAG: hypothetical protein K2H43_06870 [Clostridia bacterium]|nr:hypothetical protein [Clostridia bacterium]